jgi:phosphatidate cytidylyltransferase
MRPAAKNPSLGPNEASLTRLRVLSMTWQRLVTGALLIPVVVAIVWWSPMEVVAVLALLTAGLAMVEFFALTELAGLHAYRLWTLASTAAIFFAQWAAVQGRSWTLTRDLRLVRLTPLLAPSVELVLVVFVIGMALIVFSSKRPLKDALGDMGASAMALLLIALPLSSVVRLAAVATIGPRLLLFTLVLVWVGDTLAYFVGKYFGRWRMAPELSSKKTWEGAAANLIGSVGAGVAFAGTLRIDPWQCMIMAGLANVAGQIGDLLESSYKRSAGVKDSGTLLPGHGGMLDRIDALILAAPAVWYYFIFALGPRS